MSPNSENRDQYGLPANVLPARRGTIRSEQSNALYIVFGVLIGAGSLALVCALLGLIILVNSRHPQFVTPPSTTIPVPPQAQQINTANQDTANEIPSWYSTRQETRFTINESPDAVIAYYKGELAKSGWSLKSESLKGQTHSLQFTWLPGCSDWAFFLFAAETSTSHTSVQLNFAVSGCE